VCRIADAFFKAFFIQQLINYQTLSAHLTLKGDTKSTNDAKEMNRTFTYTCGTNSIEFRMEKK
jgi:hypothetical protein